MAVRILDTQVMKAGDPWEAGCKCRRWEEAVGTQRWKRKSGGPEAAGIYRVFCRQGILEP